MLKIRECRKFMKVCSKCKRLKLVKNNFGKNKLKKDGIDIYCKKCRHSQALKKHICNNCGKEYKNTNKYSEYCPNCLREFGNYTKNNLAVECDWCKKQIKVPIYRLSINKKFFCCRECYGKWCSKNRAGKNNPMFGVHRFGEYNPNYNPNLKSEDRNKYRDNFKISNWRNEVFKRDNYTCQITGDNKGGNLVSHHLYSYNKYKKLRYDINNGITITEDIHKLFHKLYGYGNNTKEQFEEFKRRYNNKEFEEVV